MQTIDGIAIPTSYGVWADGVFKRPDDDTLTRIKRARADRGVHGDLPEPDVDTHSPWTNQPVCSCPLWVRGISTDKHGIQTVEVATGDGQSVWVPRASLVESRVLARALAARGVPIIEKESAGVAEYLTACAQEPSVPRKQLLAELGHHEGRYVLPHEALTATGTDESICCELQMPGLIPAGDLETWRKEIQAASDKYPAVSVALAGVLAAPLLPILGEASFLLYYWGQPKTGKSAAHILAMSAFSSVDDGLYATLDCTVISLTARLQRFRGMPIILDEWEQGKHARLNPSALIYNLASDRGRGRARQDGTLAEQKQFSAVALSNGEHEISDYADGGVAGGARHRMVSIRVTERMPEASEWRALSRAQHGHAGREFVMRLLADRDDGRDFRREFLALASQLEARHETVSPTRVKLCATMGYAARLAHEYLDLDFGPEDAWADALVRASTREDAIAEESLQPLWQRALDVLRELVASQPAAFPAPGSATHNGMRSLGQCDLGRGEIHILPSVAVQALERAKIPPARAWAELAEQGIMLTSGGKFTVQRRTVAGRAYFRVFRYESMFGPNQFQSAEESAS